MLVKFNRYAIRLCLLYMTLPAAICMAAPNMELSKVADGIYVHHGQHLDIDDGYQGDICNVSVVIGKQGVAVIDTGGSVLVGTQLLQAIRKLTPLPILYVINTHVHPDHTYGNGTFTAEKPTFIGHEKLAKQMLARQAQYEKLNLRLLGQTGGASPTIPPTQSVQTLMSIDLGERVLVIQAHPIAHTQTDISVLDPQTNTLFTGDLVFAERTPVIEGDLKGLIAVLEAINQHAYQLIVPGHGRESHNQQKIVGDALRYHRALLRDVRASIQRGVSMETTMDQAAQEERAQWLLFDVANRRNVNTVYPQLEWE